MTKINANILREDDEATLTVTVEGDPRSPFLARDDHPNFKFMIAAIVAGELEELPSLFNVADTIVEQFQRLSERVTVEQGQVRFDGVAVDSTLTQHILDAVTDGAEERDYEALVAFMEKVQTNPNRASRDQLYDWINAQEGLTITENGDMVGYKYVDKDAEHGYRSSASGKEPVRVTFGDGRSEVFTGRIPNPLGGLIEMPRDLVDSDPNRTCSVGLHIGAWNYVKRSGTILEVHVNPRDVVAVPTDYNGEKVRACRYRVVGPITQKYGQAVKHNGEQPKADVRNGEKADTERADLDLTLSPLRPKTPVAAPEPAQKVAGGFHVGDEVRLIDRTLAGAPAASVGATGTVTEPIASMADEFLFIKWDRSTAYNGQMNGGYLPGGFELVSTNVEYAEGDRVVDQDGDAGTVRADLTVDYDNFPNAKKIHVATDEDLSFTVTDRSGRSHGKGGATSQAAKGRGLNPAQDPKTGQFVNGRPGSKRDARTGRFGG